MTNMDRIEVIQGFDWYGNPSAIVQRAARLPEMAPLHGRSFVALLRATCQRGTHLAWRAGTSKDSEFGLPFLR